MQQDQGQQWVVHSAGCKGESACVYVWVQLKVQPVQSIAGKYWRQLEMKQGTSNCSRSKCGPAAAAATWKRWWWKEGEVGKIHWPRTTDAAADHGGDGTDEVVARSPHRHQDTEKTRHRFLRSKKKNESQIAASACQDDTH